MRIVIDMQGAQTESRFRGIGRYTLSLTKAIIRNNGNHEVILALNGLCPDTIDPLRAAFDDFLPQENICIWYALEQMQFYREDSEWRCEVARLMREAFLAQLKPDVVLVTSLFEGFSDQAVTSIGAFDSQKIPTAVILYDIIPLLNSKQYLKPHPQFARFYKRKIEHLKRASRLLAISESTAAETCAALGISNDNDKVINISAACDDIFRPFEITKTKKKQLLERFSIAQPFILYSGGADARKNLHRLIKAYTRLPKPLYNSYQLVIAGKLREDEMFDLRRVARSHGIGKSKLIFTGFISDEELAHLYNLCIVFVLPSWHEGFGLPALEAMSCGAPVIGASATSLPEVIGCKDALFDPFDELAICQKLTNVLEDTTFRSKLAMHGLKQAKTFSWDASARRAISVFDGLHSAKTGNSIIEDSENKLPQLINAIAAVVPSNISEKEACSIACTINLNYNISREHSMLMHRENKTTVKISNHSILLKSGLCRQDQIESEAFQNLAERLGEMRGRLHRKIWERCFIVQALYERKLLQPGIMGLGFAVGTEPLPSLLCSLGVSICATDLCTDAAKKQGWIDTNQHASSIESMNLRKLCSHELLKNNCVFRNVDMNDIPDDLNNFDFIWSSCALEHLGSLIHGEAFIYNAMKCLKPGGFAIHTTEYNLTSNSSTIFSGSVVLYRRQDIEKIIWNLRGEGHKIDIDFTEGSLHGDLCIDFPPYKHNPHLRFQLDDYVATSIGLIIQKAK
jgi:glycosyltransferase involved in cell wall biosynthesis